MKRQKRKFLLAALLAVSSLTLFSGCGQQAFNITPTAQTSQAAGSYTIPAKVDIILAQDDTGSIIPIQSEIQNEIPNFLSQLQNKNWDYRFTLMPLTAIANLTSTQKAITQIAPSRYDGNWGSLWTSPFPGADPTIGRVDADLFRTLGPVSGLSAPFFNFSVSATTASASIEPAFQAISTRLKHSQAQSKFIRSDALLAVIVVSNGEDTSGLKTCVRSDGAGYLCTSACYDAHIATKTTHECPNAEMDVGNLAEQKLSLTSIKPSSPNGVKVFSIVSGSYTSNCRGKAAFAGSRYAWMSKETGGQAYDVCASNSISSALTGIAQNLQAIQLSKRQSYIVIENQQPEENSIRVFKLTNDGREIELAQNATNGWVYEGGPRAEYEIHDPVTERLKYGYVIRLNGAAQAIGSEIVYARFTAKGAKDGG